MQNWEVEGISSGGNPVVEKSFDFAKRVVLFYNKSAENKYDKPISKQFLRSGTSIGANIAEAQRAQSAGDFRAKMNISLKEASESEYWLRLLHETGIMDTSTFDDLHPRCEELIRILVAIVKNSS